MRGVTSRAPLCFERRVFERERTLLVCVTLNASRVRTGGQSGLLELKTTMRIVAITTFHGPFENFVMERRVELGLHFTVATQAELRLANFQHMEC